MEAIRQYAWNLWVLLTAAILLTVPLWLPPKVVSLVDGDYPHDTRIYADKVNGGASEVHWLEQSQRHWQCRIREGAAQRMCGFQIAFPEGVDLSRYVGLRMGLQVHSKNKFLRVSARNFEPEFSRAGDMLTTQFNQVLVPLEDFDQPVLLKFNEFAVAEWWLNKFDVPRQFSYPHFNQVMAIGIDIGNPPELADHEFTLLSLELIGEWVTAEHWYGLLLVSWIGAILAFSGWQLLRLKSRQRRDKKAYLDCASSNGPASSSAPTFRDSP